MIVGSVIFYGAVIANILHTVNVLRGLFHGRIQLENSMSDTRKIETFTIAESITIVQYWQPAGCGHYVGSGN